jgi:hypothetical protein
VHTQEAGPAFQVLAVDRGERRSDAPHGIQAPAARFKSRFRIPMDTRRWNELIDACDVAGLAEQLRSVGAGYLILTIGQNSGYYLAPNPTYDRLVGARRSRLARRDLVSDLSAALRERGVTRAWSRGSSP